MNALAVVSSRYEPPAISWAAETATEQSGLWWVVWVLVYSAALAWASYCIYAGGSPDIDFSWFRWKISCYR